MSWEIRTQSSGQKTKDPGPRDPAPGSQRKLILNQEVKEIK
jgi:hypothetical protein